LDEVFVKVNAKLRYLWRADDHEGDVLEAVVTSKRNKAAALKLLKRNMRSTGPGTTVRKFRSPRNTPAMNLLSGMAQPISTRAQAGSAPSRQTSSLHPFDLEFSGWMNMAPISAKTAQPRATNAISSKTTPCERVSYRRPP
jgi:hypothetical protein